MISALMDLLNTCYECGDYVLMEVVAHTVQHTIPDDIVSLHFLGLAYLRTGRKQDALALFRRLRKRSSCELMLNGTPLDENAASATPTAATGCYLEATALNPHLTKAWHAAVLEVEQINHLEDKPR